MKHAVILIGTNGSKMLVVRADYKETAIQKVNDEHEKGKHEAVGDFEDIKYITAYDK